MSEITKAKCCENCIYHTRGCFDPSICEFTRKPTADSSICDKFFETRLLFNKYEHHFFKKSHPFQVLSMEFSCLFKDYSDLQSMLRFLSEYIESHRDGSKLREYQRHFARYLDGYEKRITAILGEMEKIFDCEEAKNDTK